MLLMDRELSSSLELDQSLMQSKLHLQICIGAAGTGRSQQIVRAGPSAWKASALLEGNRQVLTKTFCMVTKNLKTYFSGWQLTKC